MEWDELLERVQKLRTVSARSDHGQALVDDLNSIGLNARPGQRPDTDETRCVEEIAANWIASNNFRVSLLGVDLLSEVVGYLGIKFRSLLIKVELQLTAKFGDPKCKDPAIQLLLNIFKASFGGPDAVSLERILRAAWNDKLWRVRMGGCQLLRHILDRTCEEYFQGQAKDVGLSKLIPNLLVLADGDKQADVREAAMEVFVAGYRCFGSRIKTDLIKRAPKRLHEIMEKLQQVLPDESVIRQNQTPTRAGATPGSRPGSRTGSRTPSGVRPGSRINSGTFAGGRKRGTGGGDADGNRLSAGAVGVTELENEMNQSLPDIKRYPDLSDRGVDALLENAKEKLTSPRTEWEQRVTELRLLRLLTLEQLLFQMSGAELRKMAPSFNAALADLRSAVTREACMTVASMAKNTPMGAYASMANLVIPNLIKLIPNSARIMSSSAVACLTIILRDSHNHKFIGHFTEQLRESKSVVTRRKCIEFLAQILRHWSVDELSRPPAVLDDITQTLKKTLQDPDGDARQTAREGFQCLHDKFPDDADYIKAELPLQVQKMLNGSSNLSRQGSMESLTSNGSQSSSVGSARTPGSNRGRPRKASQPRNPPTPSYKRPQMNFGRSRSDLDPTAMYQFGPRSMSSTNGSLGRPGTGTTPKRPGSTSKYGHVVSSYSQKSLTPKKKTISQPGSRSSSPPGQVKPTGHTPKRRTPSRIPRSAASSRESSPDGSGFRIDRRILPTGAAGSRLISDILGMESIVPSTAITRLHGATSNVERKEALQVIGRMSDQNQQLAKADLRKLTDIVQKLITTGTDKTLIHVFDVIPRILKAYAHEEPMKEWLYVLLTGILKRLGQLLGQHREKALEVLDSIRDEYPKDFIYSRVTKFLIDQTAVPSAGQKSAILRFLRNLNQYLDSSIIQNSSETRLVISKLVGWCNEPKNAEVRREAAASIRSLFALNPAQFSAALAELPKPFQEGATKALKESTTVEAPSISSSSGNYDSLPNTNSWSTTGRPPRRGSDINQATIPKYKLPSPAQGFRKANSDLVSSELKDMTKAIQSLNFDGNIDDDETFLQAESKTLDLTIQSPESMRLSEVTFDTTISPGVLEPVDLVNRPNSSNNKNLLLEAIRLFQRNDPESSQAAVKIVRETIRDPTDDGDENKWNRVFPLLLETAEDGTARNELRVAALHCLRDISDTKSSVASDNAETAISKFLAIMACDQDDRTLKDVTRSSQNAALALLRNLSIWASLTILAGHVEESFPVGRDAIDLCRSIIEEKQEFISDSNNDTPEAQKSIHQLLPKLMEQWQSEQAAVRKAVVYCLVLFHIAKEEVVQPYLAQASTTNKRLFDLYLKKHTSTK